MNGPDVEGVLGRHEKYEWWPMTREFICTCETSLGTSYPDPAHRAHVAAAVRAEVRAWLESEGARGVLADAYDSRPAVESSADSMRAALAALAEQVGQVASVGEGEG